MMMSILLKESKEVSFNDAQNAWEKGKKLYFTNKKFTGTKNIIPIDVLLKQYPNLVQTKDLRGAITWGGDDRKNTPVIDVTFGQLLSNAYGLNRNEINNSKFYILGENKSSLKNLFIKEGIIKESPNAMMNDPRTPDEIRFFDLIKQYNPDVYSKYKSIVQNKGIKSALVKYQDEFPKNKVSTTMKLAGVVGKTKQTSLGSLVGGIVKGDITNMQNKVKEIVKTIPKDFIKDYNENWEKNKGFGEDIVFRSTVNKYLKNKGLDWIVNNTKASDFDYVDYAKKLLAKRFPSLGLK